MIDPQSPQSPQSTIRRALPNRRETEAFELTHDAATFHIGVGRDYLGNVAEIFISNHKTSSPLDLLAKDCATIISISLQCGVDFRTLRNALCRSENGSPQSFVGAILDEIFGSPET